MKKMSLTSAHILVLLIDLQYLCICSKKMIVLFTLKALNFSLLNQ